MKKTPLHEVHVALKARLVEFAGWEMPIQYRTGINEEHVAVRTGCGIFDVSHMGQLEISGPDAVTFLQYAALNDAAKLRTGRAHYTMLPNDQGGLVDDVYLYRNSDDSFTMVTNAANHDAAAAHLRQLAAGRDVTITDSTASRAVMAVQGPEAVALLSRVAGTDLEAIRKNASGTATIAGTGVSLTRTGYTGEDGFEVYCPPAQAAAVWEAITDAGAVPCGLGARDTLRLEAGFPLFGNELTASSNPLCTPMAWVVKDKDFYGRAAMMPASCERVLIGLQLDERGIPRSGYRILKDGSEAGTITSGTISPLTRRAIALGWLSPELAEPGTRVAVEIRGQPVDATVVTLPFPREQQVN